MIDLSIFRQMLLSNEFKDISSDLEKFDNRDCYFYYDESNNIRKLWLDENDFNASVDSDFVLGGVMHIGEYQSIKFKDLKNKLNIQKTAKELKFKHISSSKDFLGCLSEYKVNIFFEWFYQSNLFVHYSNINNLYYAIVDIIDSIDENAFIPFIPQLKNELYKISVTNYQEFYNLLVSVNYPNIALEKIQLFYQRIIEFTDSIREPSFEIELFRQILKRGLRQNKLIFLQDNPEKTIIENYFMFYLRPIGVFSKSQHIFDNEYCIENQFVKCGIYSGHKMDAQFKFVDSKDQPLIQISDCIVGVLGKYYTFINNISINEANDMFNNITPIQKCTLNLFAKILKKSEDYSKLLFHSCASLHEQEIDNFILSRALEIF